MPPVCPFADEAEAEIHALKDQSRASGWKQTHVDALFHVFDRWMNHPRLLDPNDQGLLRMTVLNELTFLISEPIVGDHAWEYIRSVVRKLGHEDHHELRVSWLIATFELAAEAPEVPHFLEKLFSLAGDKNTRWAVFGAYKNVPWRLRPHAHKYSKGKITDDDCDQWLIEEGWGEDEFLMQRT
jgi:hypothetical protein